MPGFLLPLVTLTEIAGGILIRVGWHTRIVAFLVAGYAVLAVLTFHHNLASTAEQIIALAELAVAGGLLVLVGRGAGAWSLDARRKHSD
ncbi:MAG: DoxX family protein [Rhodanobacter sp.]